MYLSTHRTTVYTSKLRTSVFSINENENENLRYENLNENQNEDKMIRN